MNDIRFIENTTFRIAVCYNCHEDQLSQIRDLTQEEQQDAYNIACLEWQQPDKPNSVPMDEDLRDSFFMKCQVMMDSNPSIPEDQFLVSFACHAILLAYSMVLDSHPKKELIIGDAKRLATEWILRAQAESYTDVGRKYSDPPTHIMQALFPDNIDAKPSSGSDALEKAPPFFIGRSFEYRDSQTGHSVTCLVHDCGTSHLLGKWFEVSCGKESPSRITWSEMMDIWEARVTDPK